MSQKPSLVQSAQSVPGALTPDSYRWGPGSIESPLAWMWLANLLYPDHFNFDIRSEITEWYPKIYGHTPTPEQIDTILELEINGTSANYGAMAAG